jgi:hypothetical protein
MAEDIQIQAKLSVDTADTNKRIKEINDSIAESKKALSQATYGTKEYSEAQKALDSSSKDLAKAQKTLGDSTEASTGKFSQLKSTVGGMVPGLDAAAEGASGLGKQLLVLAANPVVLILAAIVAVLTLVYTAFKNSFEGGEKLEQVFAGIKAVGQSLIDSLEKIGSAIVKIFKFDFSGAIDDMKGVVDAAKGAYSAMSRLTQQAQGLHKEQLANDLDQAERAKKLAILREQALDETVPIAKRKAALKELKADAEQNSKDDIDLAKRTTENKIAQLTLQKDGARKNQDEINKLKIDQINVETDNANELRRIGKQLTAADKAEKAEQDAAAKEALAKQKELLKEREEAEKEHQAAMKKIQDDGEKAIADSIRDLAKHNRENELKQIAREKDARMAAAEAAGLSVFNIIEAYQKKRDDINKKFNDKEAEDLKKSEEEQQKITLDAQKATLAGKRSIINDEVNDTRVGVEARKELAEQEAKHKDMILSFVSQKAMAFADIIGKQTVVGKGLAIASATIDTYQAANSALKANYGPFGPAAAIARFVTVAATIATGIKNIKSIASVQVPGGGSSGNVPSASSISAPITPQRSTTSLDANSIQQVGNAASAGASRAFVLSTDIQNTQERDALLARQARLG